VSPLKNIFTAVLALAILSSPTLGAAVRLGCPLIGPHLAAASAHQNKDHSCCKKHNHSQSDPTKKERDSTGSCTMQCCNIVPALTDTAPAVVGRSELTPVCLIRLQTLHTLTDPTAVFHPPRT
jgi:hypothetical protein